jgi:hypothetical protein
MLAAGNTTAVSELQHVRGYQPYLGRTQDPAKVIERIHPACLR